MNQVGVDGYETESYSANGYFAFDDFHELGRRAGLPEKMIMREIQQFDNKTHEVYNLVNSSFLDEDFRKLYIDLFDSKLKRLNYSG